MSAFIFYIVNLQEGTIQGTNDVEGVLDSGVLDDSDYVVIHKDSGKYGCGSGLVEDEVQEFATGFEEEPDGEEDE